MTRTKRSTEATTFSTLKVRGKIVSQRSGSAVIVDEINGKANIQHRSSILQKFADGTDVEMTIRVQIGSAGSVAAGLADEIQLLSATALLPDARYQIYFVGLVNEHSLLEIGPFVKDCQDIFGFDERTGFDLCDEIGNALGDDATEDESILIAISPALNYDDCRAAVKMLNASHPGASIMSHKARRDNALGKVDVKLDKTNTIEKASGFPEFVGNHWFNDEEREVFSVVDNIVRNKKGWVNVFLKGPSGYGKTSKFEALAEHLGLRCVTVDCSTVNDPEAWFGYQEAREGSTIVDLTEFSEAVREGNAVIILDEINRIEPQIGNPMFPILDHRRRTRVHNQDIICGPGIVFGFTVNLGIKYAGTHVMDAAFMNRGTLALEVGPMPQRVEAAHISKLFPELAGNTVNDILALVTELRKVIDRQMIEVDVSTRTSEKLGLVMSSGMSLETAARTVIVNWAPMEDRKSLMDAIQLVLKSRP